MPQQRRKEGSKRPRGERDNIKLIDLKFERWQVVRFRKASGNCTLDQWVKIQKQSTAAI